MVPADTSNNLIISNNTSLTYNVWWLVFYWYQDVIIYSSLRSWFLNANTDLHLFAKKQKPWNENSVGNLGDIQSPRNNNRNEKIMQSMPTILTGWKCTLSILVAKKLQSSRGVVQRMKWFKPIVSNLLLSLYI